MPSERVNSECAVIYAKALSDELQTRVTSIERRVADIENHIARERSHTDILYCLIGLAAAGAVVRAAM
tara:strand:+ start:148 stop:351 length:204 start_codon:yes stop_codon:yes gene_type:complete